MNLRLLACSRTVCHSPRRGLAPLALALGLAGLLAQSAQTQADNLPPKVALIQPADGQTFISPSDISIAVIAEDADGYVRSVEVWADAVSLGAVTPNPAVANPVNPWQWTWSNPPLGDHKLVALATDDQGLTNFSTSVTITIKSQGTPSGATLVFNKPVDGQAFPASAIVSIDLVATDPLGDIRHVEFYANDLYIGRSDQWTKDAVFPGRPREHFLDWRPAAGGNYRLTAKALDSADNPVESKPVSITVADGPQLPMVGIEATVEETSEPAPGIRVQPGVFTISRTGDPTNSLTVSLVYDGSATPGVDYKALPESVTIPAGSSKTELLVEPLEDSLIEGGETVSAMLVDNVMDRAPDHVIDPLHSAAKLLIHDASETSATLQITAPKDGDTVQPGQVININATAIDPNGYIARVEFFDFETSIGVSQIAFFRAPDPGTPIYHNLEWPNAAAGKHALMARAVDSQGNPVASAAVYIAVTEDSRLPMVRVSALDPEATEFSPLVEVIDPARFSFSREGDLSRDLDVVFSLHGTAEPDKDYKRPDRVVRIPAGQSEVTLDIVPLPDDIAENMETIAVRLEDAMTISSLPSPPSPYLIAADSREAAAVIYDRTPPQNGALELALPSAGDVYQPYQSVPMIAAAFHPSADVTHVDFYADEKWIGSSDILFIRANMGGLIFHRFDWKEPVPGDHVISARAKLPDGTELASSKIPITIPSVQPVTTVAILSPPTGASFNVGDSIDIKAAARDADNAVPSLALLIDDAVVQTVNASDLSFQATNLVAGAHVLVARALDSKGVATDSAPVKILVGDGTAVGGTGSAPAAELKRIDPPKDGKVRLQLTGPVDAQSVLEVSTDLVNWTELGTVYLPEGKLAYDDDINAGPKQRFYRIRAR